MQEVEKRGADVDITDGQSGAENTELVRALASMGLENLDPADITPEFQDPLIRLAASWEVAISETTLSSRRCDLRRFSQWCGEHSYAPFLSDAVLADLIDRHLADAGQTYSPGTIKRIGSNLTSLARGVGSGIAADIAQSCRTQSARAAQKRERNQGVQREKHCLSVAQMQSLRQSIASEIPASMLAIRDLAIFDTACDLLASCSEIIGMRLRDLNLQKATIRFPGTRSDQADRGTVFAIAPRTVASIVAWMEATDLQNFGIDAPGTLPVFAGIMNGDQLRIGPHGVPEPMNGRTLTRALQRHAARLDISGVGGHSLRRSMARALYEVGVPEEEIVRKGRWSSLQQMRDYVGLTTPIGGAVDFIF